MTRLLNPHALHHTRPGALETLPLALCSCWVNAPYEHDFSLETESLTVFTEGGGVNFNVDNHRQVPGWVVPAAQFALKSLLRPCLLLGPI